MEPTRTHPPGPRIGFTPAELAAALDVTPRTVGVWIRSGRVAAVGSERRRLITPDAVTAAFGADVTARLLDGAAREGRPVYVPAVPPPVTP